MKNDKSEDNSASEFIPEDNLAMGLVERCFDLSKEFFSYRCKGWKFVPDQV